MSDATYRHTITGAQRVSSRHLGYPWEVVEEEGTEGPTKAELQAQAKELGISQQGTKAELEARLKEAQDA